MTYYENMEEAPAYLQEVFKLIGLDYGTVFGCMYEPTNQQLHTIISMLQAEQAFRESGESV